MKKFVILTLLFFVPIFKDYSIAQSLTKFSGLAYFDYFYNISNKDESKTGLNGFQFRRVFFTADFDVTNKFSTRFRVESEEKSLLTEPRFNISLKDLYAQYKFESSQIFIGLMPTPQIEIEERYWGYRSVEKIQSDLRNMVSTRDIGIALRGQVSMANISYWLMLGNNSSHGAEKDKYKRLYFQMSNQFNSSLAASIDLNYANEASNKDYIYSRLGIYYLTENYNGGMTVSGGIKKKFSPTNSDINEIGLSLFNTFNFIPFGKAFFRFDMYEPNLNAVNDREFTFIAGFDYKLEKNFSIIPNLIYNDYENRNSKDDLTFRITFYYQF